MLGCVLRCRQDPRGPEAPDPGLEEGAGGSAGGGAGSAPTAAFPTGAPVQVQAAGL